MRFRFPRRLLWAVTVVALLTLPIGSSTLNIPYTFAPGGVIYASQMNSNFNAIRSVVNALDDANVANASITGSAKLIDGTVTLAKMATDSVDASKIVTGGVATDEILDGTILQADMAASSVGSSQIIDGTIVNGDIADGTIAEAKLDINSAPSSTYILYWNGSKLDYRPPPCSPIGIALRPPAVASTVYIPPGFSDAGGLGFPTSDPRTYEAPQILNVSSLRVKSTVAPGVATVITVVKNGVDTSITCTINAGTACQYGAANVTFAAGDSLTFKIAAGPGDPSAGVLAATVCTGF